MTTRSTKVAGPLSQRAQLARQHAAERARERTAVAVLTFGLAFLGMATGGYEGLLCWSMALGTALVSPIFWLD